MYTWRTKVFDVLFTLKQHKIIFICIMATVLRFWFCLTSVLQCQIYKLVSSVIYLEKARLTGLLSNGLIHCTVKQQSG